MKVVKTLKFATDNIDLHASVLEGMSLILELIKDNLEHVENSFLIDQRPVAWEKKKPPIITLQEQLVDLYAAILVYLAMTRYYFARGSWGKHLLLSLVNKKRMYINNCY